MHQQIDHPCVQHKLAIIRDAETGHKRFRELATEITEFLCYEALKNVKTKKVEVSTPLATAICNKIDVWHRSRRPDPHEFCVSPLRERSILSGSVHPTSETPRQQANFGELHEGQRSNVPWDGRILSHRGHDRAFDRLRAAVHHSSGDGARP